MYKCKTNNLANDIVPGLKRSSIASSFVKGFTNEQTIEKMINDKIEHDDKAVKEYLLNSVYDTNALTGSESILDGTKEQQLLNIKQEAVVSKHKKQIVDAINAARTKRMMLVINEEIKQMFIKEYGYVKFPYVVAIKVTEFVDDILLVDLDGISEPLI